MKVVYANPTLKEYLSERKQILKDFYIWKRLTAEEKERFYACSSEIQVDNLMAYFRRQYL